MGGDGRNRARPVMVGLVMAAMAIALAAGPVPTGQAAEQTVARRSATAGDTTAATTTARAKVTKRFPTAGSTGVPRGWKPKRTFHHDVVVSRPGAVIKDIRLVDADLWVDAPNVTIKRVEIIGGKIDNVRGGKCANGLVVARSTFRRSATRNYYEPAIGTGGYLARGIKMLDVLEGFRVGGRNEGCGRVKIANSFVRLKYPPDCVDWHGDGIQGYEGPRLVVRNTVLIMVEKPGCGGTAPFFYPAWQGNQSVDIDRLMVQGGGYPFRLGEPGAVRNLKIVHDSWDYGPIDVQCSLVSAWKAQIVRVVAKGAKAKKVRQQRCNTAW